MLRTFPGTTVEISTAKKGASKQLFDGIFATGGITLSQLSIMTGLEPYIIQNWVKRKFLSPPVGRTYSKEQLARVAIINMLREELQIEKICNVLDTLGGDPKKQYPAVISTSELYHLYFDMLAENAPLAFDGNEVTATAEKVAVCFNSNERLLSQILQLMLYAHKASELRDKANQILYSLE